MALRAVPDHPKFADLKSRLKLPKGAVLGWLEAIWHFTGRFTPQGNIGKYDDHAIEAWVEWDGEPGALIAALIAARWVDADPKYRLLVHDWHIHADKAAKNAINRSGSSFCVPSVRTVYPLPVPVPVPVPESSPVPVPVPESQPASARALVIPIYEPIPKTERPIVFAGETQFHEWWALWSKERGTANKNVATTTYLSVVDKSQHELLMACTRSYCAHAEPHKGFNPDKFLVEQARDNFEGKWPPRPQTGKPPVRETPLEPLDTRPIGERFAR